jgi:L-alanine-DL-glutamate epimerase-like enolase superfamily enzyme
LPELKGASRVKITEIRWTPVLFRYREPESASYGLRVGQVNLIVEVETDAGITGLGETYTASGAWLDAVSGALESARRLLVGEDPRNIERLTQLYYRVGNWRTMPRMGNMAFSGVEMACWDIAGRSLGQPLHRLFGGALRQQVGFFGYLQRKAISAMAEDAASLVAQGYRVLYFKVGFGAKDDVDAVAAVREAAGAETKIRVDANQAWDVGTAVQRIKAMQPYDLEFVEQPVLAEDWQALAQVRARVDVPVAANEGIWTPHDLTQVIRHQAADIVVMGVQWVGGLWALKKMAAAAEMAGLRFCRHCVDSAIGTSAALGVMATLGNLMDGNQFYLPHFAEEVIRGTPPTVGRGSVAIPQASGIGVELDPEKLQRNRYQPGVHGKIINYYQAFGGSPEERLAPGASAVPLKEAP